jgi:hypothetical protein
VPATPDPPIGVAKMVLCQDITRASDQRTGSGQRAGLADAVVRRPRRWPEWDDFRPVKQRLAPQPLGDADGFADRA